MSKVVVVGGSGFVGSHTADELSQRGHNVTILDLVPSPWVRPDQQMIVANLEDGGALAAAFAEAEVVYHFAGVSDIQESKEHPIRTLGANIMGVAHVLDAATRAGVRRFLYASTMYVYSTHGAFYRASKQAAEILIETYAEQFGIEYTLLRYGSLYGPRSQAWNGIRRFVTQIVKDGHVDYGGSGAEMREYIHVQDAARLSVDLLEQRHANTAITITGQQLIRVDELFSILFEISGVPRSVSYGGDSGRMDHYGQTPYRYAPKSARKLVPQEFVDLGQGLLDVIRDVHDELGTS